MSTGFFIPDRQLRAPELSIPGRKPTGPVEIDWAHPAAPDYHFDMGVNGGEVIRDLVTKQTAPIINPDFRIINGQKGAYTRNNGDAFVLPVSGDCYAVSFSILWAEKDYSEVVTDLMRLLSMSSTYQLRTAEGTSYLTGETVWIQGPSNQRRGILTNTWSGDEIFHCVMWWNGTAYDFFINGERQIAVDGSVGGVPLITFSTPSFPSADNDNNDKIIGHITVWTRPINEGAASIVARNPYQFLKPAGT